VLIFERIREEMALGKTPRAAVDAGYSRATLTILDANVTTLIAALVLFQFGTGPIKGFAVTLSLGVLASLFTALILSRTIFEYFLVSRKVKTISICRNEKSPTAQIKSLCYLDNILAMEEAHEQGADEALMLNTAGNIAEGSISNIFFVKDDQLFTPPLSDGVLPGTMRRCVLETASKLGMSVTEDSLGPEIIQTCDEAFLTNSLFRVRPIHELDGRLIPSEVWADRILQEIKAVE